MQDAKRYASRHPMAKVIQQFYEKENNHANIDLDEDNQENNEEQ